jgi:hypothetical protein
MNNGNACEISLPRSVGKDLYTRVLRRGETIGFKVQCMVSELYKHHQFTESLRTSLNVQQYTSAVLQQKPTARTLIKSKIILKEIQTQNPGVSRNRLLICLSQLPNNPLHLLSPPPNLPPKVLPHPTTPKINPRQPRHALCFVLPLHPAQ